LSKRHVVIINPTTANANNGNWHTATRWARLLRNDYRVTILPAWDGQACDVLIALHARRSAPSIAAAAASPDIPVIVVLTGTDLYRDIHVDADAQRSLRQATRLMVLQEAGLQELAPALRAKASVIYQSAPSLKPNTRRTTARHFDVVMIGHLREEKDPLTFMRAAGMIPTPKVRLLHVGGILDPALGAAALDTQRAHPCYRWCGPLSHARTRQLLKRSQLMAITSRMEGGANVIIEAVTSGVAVVASDISGNRGMLGDDYAGYFPVGDSAALAQLIGRCVADPAFHTRLQEQCATRAPLFAPEREHAMLLQLLDNVSSPCADLSDQRIPTHRTTTA
jgi:putative glycosyltransferase (TIGR04348 family)